MKKHSSMKYLPYCLACCLACLLTAAGCTNSPDQQTAPPSPPSAADSGPSAQKHVEKASQPDIFLSIKPREAYTLMQNRKDLLVIDLREFSEMRQGAIEGSQIIPISRLMKGQASLPTDRPLLLVCAVGGRSWGVGRYLARQGVREVYNLEGGIGAWKKAGLPLRF